MIEIVIRIEVGRITLWVVMIVPPIITWLLMLAKPVVDVGCFFQGFGTVVPQMANISTDFTLHV
jgi:hypothetical protein